MDRMRLTRSPGIASHAARAFLGLAPLVLVGCMSVHIHAGDTPVAVHRHLGALQVQVGAPERQVVGQLVGLGIAATPMGLTAGYTRQRWAVLGPGCRAVLWVEEGVDEALRRDLEQVAGVCLVQAAGREPLRSGAGAAERRK